jgi:hypothetical protein
VSGDETSPLMMARRAETPALGAVADLTIIDHTGLVRTS